MRSGRVALKAALALWPRRRWLAALAAAATYVVVAVPTDLIDTPFFVREVPPTWWSFPVLALTAALAGLVAATYVARLPEVPPERGQRFGLTGAIVSFFAVGCPVCNKLVLLALGTSGAQRPKTAARCRRKQRRRHLPAAEPPASEPIP
jgi:hypothetical protein